MHCFATSCSSAEGYKFVNAAELAVAEFRWAFVYKGAATCYDHNWLVSRLSQVRESCIVPPPFSHWHMYPVGPSLGLFRPDPESKMRVRALLD